MFILTAAEVVQEPSSLASFLASLPPIVLDPTHLVVEAVLLGLIIYLVFSKSYKIKEPQKDKLTPQEEDLLLKEWEPAPLVPDGNIWGEGGEENGDEFMLQITKNEGTHIEIESKRYVNMSSHGYLGYQTHPEVIKSGIEGVHEYGVGACGPRGFYGTVDAHLNLESALAKYFDLPHGIVYSSGFATISSAIPSFCKAGDYLFVDRGVNMSIQYGLILARGKTFYFNHNDIADLELCLAGQAANMNKVNRVFVIVEGIYQNSGVLCNLPEIVKLKAKYPFRIIMDEAHSFGVLGKTGRGITEHFDVPVGEVEILTGWLGNSLGTIGGFSVGEKDSISHQRLNSNSYVFSCSLPPYVCTSTIKALELLGEGVEVARLQKNAKYLHQVADELVANSPLMVLGDSVAPFALFKLKNPPKGKRVDENKYLQSVVEKVKEEGIVITRIKFAKQEKFVPAPMLKICVQANHTQDEIRKAVQALVQAVKDSN